MLTPGAPAPDFALPAADGRIVRLADFRGKTVVLYFYPEDDTPGCTTQACDLRDAWADVTAAGAVVLGVSPDGAESHRAFGEKYALPFPLLSDVDHAVAMAYGSWGEKRLFGHRYEGLRRNTFIIGPDGTIRHVFENVRPRGHAAQVLAALRD